MSVVVQMEMPQGCVDCPFMNILLCCCAKGRKYTGSSPVRPSWCPILCQLPEGHGELIERQPIIQFIEDGLNRGEYGHDQIEVMTEVFVAETIVPAERSET